MEVELTENEVELLQETLGAYRAQLLDHRPSPGSDVEEVDAFYRNRIEAVDALEEKLEKPPRPISYATESSHYRVLARVHAYWIKYLSALSLALYVGLIAAFSDAHNWSWEKALIVGGAIGLLGAFFFTFMIAELIPDIHLGWSDRRSLSDDITRRDPKGDYKAGINYYDLAEDGTTLRHWRGLLIAERETFASFDEAIEAMWEGNAKLVAKKKYVGPNGEARPSDTDSAFEL